HRCPRRQITPDRLDGPCLVWRLGKGEAGGKSFVICGRRVYDRRGSTGPFGGESGQAHGTFCDRGVDRRTSLLPSGSVQAIQADRVGIGAITPDTVCVADRYGSSSARGILQDERLI